MPNDRRNLIPGGSYFFTVNLQDRTNTLLTLNIDLLRTVVARVRAKIPFRIEACVMLPDHMHCLWTLPAGDHDYSARWKAIKKGFSWSIPPGEHRSDVQRNRTERGSWQRRFWEHTIRNDRDVAAHADYIHSTR
jgi:putative transposase